MTRGMAVAAATAMVAAVTATGRPAPASASDAAGACGPPSRGALACMAGAVCRCDWSPGGLVTGRRPGWQWSCRIEQECGGDPSPPLGDGDAPP